MDTRTRNEIGEEPFHLLLLRLDHTIEILRHYRRKRLTHRYAVSVLVMTACLGGILTRLLFVQGIGSQPYIKAAQSEYVHEVSYLGERGSVLDRNGDAVQLQTRGTLAY